MIKYWRHALFICVIFLAACAHKRPATVPMPQLAFNAPVAHQGEKQLLILLPGIGGKLGDFERYGFIDAVRAARPELDVVVMDAHFGYYRERQIIERLRQDVIVPAKGKGYCAIHLAGISLGGYGALLYLRTHAQDVASVSLLAPYLGERKHYQHLLDQSHGADHLNDPLNLWPWLQALSDQQKAKIRMAYGREDKFVESLDLLAGLLPSDASFTIAGKHRWPVWQSLWHEGLKTQQLVPKQVCGNDSSITH